MKKFFSIGFAILILLSGMHLTIATHFCGGEVAAVKWSLSGEYASCGMEDPNQTCPTHYNIKSNCCHNEVAVYSIDNNYHPSYFQYKTTIKSVLQVFLLPANIHFQKTNFTNYLIADVSLPDKLLAADISQAEICVFRI